MKRFRIQGLARVNVPVSVVVEAESEEAIDWDQALDDLCEEVPETIGRDNSIGCEVHPSDIDTEPATELSPTQDDGGSKPDE